MKKYFSPVNKNNILLLITFISVVFIKLKYFHVGFWYDEWHSFFYSNPNFISLENFSNLVNKSVSPPIYFVIMSLFHIIFGYSPEVGRLISVIFNISSFFILHQILKRNFSYKINFFVLFFFLVNYSLILNSLELRFYSFYVFITLTNIFFFFNYLNNKSRKDLAKYFFFSLLALSSNYFLLPIIGIQFIYLFLKNRYFFFCIIIFSILFLGINFPHLLNIKSLNSQEHWGVLNLNFFLGYFFNIFFGNKILGGLILIFLVIIFFVKFKKIISNEKLLLMILFIIITYIFFISYSVIFTPVIRPRYFNHLIPLILCVFVSFIYTIRTRKIRNFILSFFAVFHIVTFIHLSLPFEKPDTDKLIRVIRDQKLPIIVDSYQYLYSENNNKISDVDKNNYESLYFINHFINLKKFKNSKIIFINKENISTYDSFLEICENNADYKTSELGDNPTCLKNNYIEFNFEIIENLKTRDFIVNVYQKSF